MKRREFIASASSMILPLTVHGLGFKSFNENSSLVKSIIETNAAVTDRILVIIYLNGGNDGLNTVIPLDQYSKYYSLRSNIAIPEANVLALAGNPKTGFHPSMTGMRNLYNDGKLAIVNSVSYPNPNQSHVRSTDILMTGVNADQYSETGWAARYLENRFPGFPVNYPNAQMTDPLAVQIGYVDTTTLKGSVQPMNISFEDPVKFYQMMGQLGTVSSEGLPCCDAGELVKFIKQQQVLSIGYSSRIKAAADAGQTMATYPGGAITDLSEQLKIVAKLIHGGLQSKIYFVEMGGFDTHASQVGSTNVEGPHAVLLKKLSDAVAAFQNDLKLQGTEDKVIGMTFSDFGRRATSNTSKGTDHGIAAPMFVFGTNIKRQAVGTNPDLTGDMEPPTTTSGNKNQDIKMQIDFRRIYRDILTDWFGTSSGTTNSIMYGTHQTTSLFSNVIESTGSGSWPDRSIWTAGCMPATTDYVRIKSGHIVNVGQDLNVRNIHVEAGGELRLLGNYNIVTTG